MNYKLPEQEKKRIEAEELLRNGLRQMLTPAVPAMEKPSIVWTFLNSNFGIWILSAVLISFLGRVYTDGQNAALEAAKKREAERAELIQQTEMYERLTLEISFRFSSTMSRLHDVDARFGEQVNSQSQEAIILALEPLVRPASDTHPPLFPEFKSYSGLALIAELRRHAPKGEQERLREILAKTSGVIHETIGESSGSLRSAKVVASLLLEHMRYSKWDNGFPYTDCPSQSPFC